MIGFQNPGVVPIEAFTTFGMSAKPSSTNPIGKFGTGMKYAVAITLRLGGTFKLWRGAEEYEFYTKEEDFRGKTFAKVRMRRRKDPFGRWRYEALPFTTELGKHWEPWMALRELEANVRDENGYSFLGRAEAEGIHDTTLIQIVCPEIEEAYSRLGDIFLPDGKPLLFEDDKVKVYEGVSNHIYYRGMRVTDLRKPSLFTYEMKNVYLTEDRTSQYPFLDRSNIMEALLAAPDSGITDQIVKESEGKFEGSFDWDQVKRNTVSSAWVPTLSRVGLPSRFDSMRNNLEYGIPDNSDIEITFELRDWIKVMNATRDMGHEDLADTIKEVLVDEGWKPEL